MKRNADRGQHRQAARAIKPPRIASRVLDAHERGAQLDGFWLGQC